MLALTATASPPVREDVAERLHLRDAAVIVRGFARPGIALEVVRTVEATDKDRAVVERVRAEAEHGVGIVYVGTRRRTTEVADALAEAGLRTAAYHGGLRRAERDEAQRRFTEDEVDVVVATSAFGMGIDKPDVRFVVHADVPGSPDSYYQEVGRAGRDGEPAVAVLFYRPEDLGLQRYFAVGVPDRDDLREVARALGRGGPDDQASSAPGGRARLPRRLARLRALVEDARALAGEDARPAAVADVAHELAEARRRVDDSRLQMMRAYAETRSAGASSCSPTSARSCPSRAGAATPAGPGPRRRGPPTTRPRRGRRARRCDTRSSARGPSWATRGRPRDRALRDARVPDPEPRRGDGPGPAHGVLTAGGRRGRASGSAGPAGSIAACSPGRRSRTTSSRRSWRPSARRCGPSR